jgi:NAD(P)-dependent dehydrogenase (short-subunit alcohol dehydrogenase family)
MTITEQDAQRAQVRVVVTGGASGIGLAIVERLAHDGYAVVIADRDVSASEAAQVRIGSAVEVRTVDVSATKSVDALIDDLRDRGLGLAGLVNCAGIAEPCPSHTLADASWNRLLDIHLSGTMRCCRAAYPLLAAAGGAIINISSVGARVGMPQRLAYNTAKAGIEGLTRTLAVEWAPRGVRVNAIAPGYVRTAMWEKLVADGNVDGERIEARIPMGRLADPREISGVAAFLLSADASFVTGQSLLVDGGMTIDGNWYADPQ